MTANAQKQKENKTMHTPTPWKVWDENNHFLTDAKTGNVVIGEFYTADDYRPRHDREIIPSLEEGKANAEFIVTAVNSFDDLVNACKMVKLSYPSTQEQIDAYEACQKALAKAGVK